MRWWVLSILLLPSVLYADELEGLRRFYGRLRSLALEAVSPDGVEVSLKVARGNRFRAVWNGHLVVSDGDTVWSYIPARRQVLISSASAALGSGLEQVITTMLEQAPLTVVRRSADTLYVRCPLSEFAFAEALLMVRPRNWQLLGIELRGEAGTQRWHIRSFQPNPPVTARDFRFQPPPGTEVIDLRR